MGRLRHYGPLCKKDLMPLIRDMHVQGYTQEAIAVMIKSSQSTVQKWLAAENLTRKRSYRNKEVVES